MCRIQACVIVPVCSRSLRAPAQRECSACWSLFGGGSALWLPSHSSRPDSPSTCERVPCVLARAGAHLVTTVPRSCGTRRHETTAQLMSCLSDQVGRACTTLYSCAGVVRPSDGDVFRAGCLQCSHVPRLPLPSARCRSARTSRRKRTRLSARQTCRRVCSRRLRSSSKGTRTWCAAPCSASCLRAPEPRARARAALTALLPAPHGSRIMLCHPCPVLTSPIGAPACHLPFPPRPRRALKAEARGMSSTAAAMITM